MSPIRGHGPKIYHAGLTGKEFNHLLERLESDAVKGGNYSDVRLAVYFIERITPQLREQGFYKDIEEGIDRVFLPIQTPEGFNVGKA
jgi:hypothetical protein